MRGYEALFASAHLSWVGCPRGGGGRLYLSRLLHTIIGSARPRISAFLCADLAGLEELSPTPEVLRYNISLLPFQNAIIIIGTIYTPVYDSVQEALKHTPAPCTPAEALLNPCLVRHPSSTPPRHKLRIAYTVE